MTARLFTSNVAGWRIVLITAIVALASPIVSDVSGQSTDITETRPPIVLPIVDAHDIRFTRISPADGLSQTRVAQIVQDDLGFIWFGTQYGLNRYDGYRFKVFVHDPRQPGSLSGAYVTALFKDRSGVLWVACGQSLNRYNPTTESFVTYTLRVANGSTPAIFITHISQDDTGALWLSTNDGLYQFTPETAQLRRFAHNPDDSGSLGDNDVKSTGQDRNGVFWVAHRGGLEQFDRTTGRVGLRLPLIRSGHGLMFHEDRAGVFWIIHGPDGSLTVFDRQTNALTSHTPVTEGDNQPLILRTMLEDRDGTMWFGSDAHGLLKFDREKRRFLRYAHRPGDGSSLADKRVTTLFQDRDDNLWVGLHQAGANFFPTKPPLFADLAKVGGTTGAELGLVGALYKDRRGVVWIGTPGVLRQIDPEIGRVTEFAPAAGTDVLFIAEHQNVLWIATSNRGLLRYDPASDQVKTYRRDPANPHSLTGDTVQRLAFRHDGTIWAATWNGLARFDPATERCTTYRPDEHSRGLNYYTVVEDSAGMVWLGSNLGLHRFDPATERFTVYRHDPEDPRSLSDNRVNAIHLDSGGGLWAGTQNGLNRFDPTTGTFHAWFARDGLSGNVVSAILEDERGALWMSTNQGVSSLDPSRTVFSRYSVADGLPGTDFTGWSAAHRTEDGEMMFGGFSGATAFRPENAASPPAPQQVVLTAFRLFGTPVELGTESPLKASITTEHSLTLPHWRNFPAFEFSALSYLHAGSIAYRYRLDGVDKDWVEIGSDQRVASYTALEPGTYTFSVQAARQRGVWSEPPATLRVQILPPWWRTGWFRAVAGLLVLGTLYVGYRARIRMMEERQREFRMLAENAPDIVMRFDRDLRILYVNSALTAYFDVSAEYASGQTATQLQIPAAGAWNGGLQRVFRTGESDICEFTCATKKGESHFESRLVPEYAPGRRDAPRSVLVITRDITQRKRAVDRLRQSEAYLAQAQKLSLTGSFGWNVATGELVWSDETYRILGYDSSVTPSADRVLARVHPDDLARVRATLNAARQSIGNLDIEHRLMQPDGTVKFVHVVAHAMQGEAGAEFVGALMDVTERHHALEAIERGAASLRKTQTELAHVARVTTLGQLSGSVAHEINQPLAGIVTNAKACLRWLAHEPPNLEEACAAAQRILRDSSRASGVIDRLRALFKKTEPVRAPININAAIEEVVALTIAEIRKHGVDLQLKLAPDLPTAVGDRIQLQQVVINLILNGIEAMRGIQDRPRELTIRTHRSENDELCVAVRDSGAGLEPANHASVFDAFYTTKPTGMGMGLTISRTIIEAHQGTISLKPNEDYGVTVSFSIPRCGLPALVANGRELPTTI